MDKNILSNKIKSLSFILIIMVIYLHSYNINYLDSVLSNRYLNFNIFIQLFFTEGLFRVAVPSFFLISGYLFFNNYLNFDSYIEKIKKRFKTLFIPFFFWSLLVIVIYFIFQTFIFQTFFSNYFTFNSVLIKNLNFLDFLNALFINPYNYPLWFLRDLILVIIISPIIYFFIKKLKYTFFFILFILWFLDIGGGGTFYLYKSEVVLFFSIGAYISISKNNSLLEKLTSKYLYILIISYIFILTIKTYINLTYFFNNELILLHKLTILMGVILFFKISNYKKINHLDLINFTFLFYVFHEPLLSFLKKIGFYFLGINNNVSFLLYIILPIIVIIILYYIGKVSKTYFPNFITIITGGRV